MRKKGGGTQKKKWIKYREETQNFMVEVENFLIQKYGELQSHWDGQLLMLASNYDMFIKCKEKIDEDGLTIRNGREKHPLLIPLKDSNTQVLKIINEFGLSPSASSKIKSTADTNEEVELISGLING